MKKEKSEKWHRNGLFKVLENKNLKKVEKSVDKEAK